MPIHIEGASEHNLQAVDVEIGEGLTVVTGVSGSGKTSLVFDTLFHEARRRFLEVFALGSVAERMPPAPVGAISGLGPAVAVGQDLLNRNPNSTLATAAGLHPFLRLLYARFGKRNCSRCGATLQLLSNDAIVERLMTISDGGPVQVLTPLLRGVTGSHRTLLSLLAQQFDPDSIIVDGQVLAGTGPDDGGSAREFPSLDPAKSHDVAVCTDSWVGEISAAGARQVLDLAQSLGAQSVNIQSRAGDLTLSWAPVCGECGTWFETLEPVHFNRRCPICDGGGCDSCAGTGLPAAAAAVTWQERRLPELLACSVSQVADFFHSARLPAAATRLEQEIGRRLEALLAVGLGYVNLDRPSPSLSRGEAQRVRLAVALTSRLEDMLHILDEPTIGQHPADVNRLLPAFRRLPGPVIYVEHDRAAAAVADQVLDLGPGAGDQGGRLIFNGTPAGLWQADTPTGRYFSQRQRVRIPESRPAPEAFLVIREATLRNLAGIDVQIPLGRLTTITGVSGSGKSTLVEDVLVASLTSGKPQGCRAIDGPSLKAVMVDQKPIGRNPRSNPATYTKLADTIRDVFAGQTGLSASHFSFNRPEGACPDCQGMGAIEVRLRYLPSTWIECETCGGRRFSDEVLAATIDFNSRKLSIADVYELPVADVGMLFQESPVFAIQTSSGARKQANQILRALVDVGLGYLPLGQPSPTLSGGEAQRIKLARRLGRPGLSGQILVLDEPTTGLHPQDVAGLLIVLDRLVRAGSTVIAVEHNLDFIAAADWVIDLGPGAGQEGGRLLYAGPRAGLAGVEGSPTAEAVNRDKDIIPRATRGGGRPAGIPAIAVRGARANNLKNINADIPKGMLTVVTGVSGSGKSSLVGDVLEAEARRRFLETLSLYERQVTREGPEAEVDSVSGLGVALAIGPERRLRDPRATVGTATEIAHHLRALLAWNGDRRCSQCEQQMVRAAITTAGATWCCPNCGQEEALAEPRHFAPTTYAAACLTCHGIGSLQVPNPEKLIAHPDKPLCSGAMYSPGFFPKGFLCKPFNSGYDLVRALAGRYGFEPEETPWNDLSVEAQHAFLFGDSEPLKVHFRSRNQEYTKIVTFPGFYGWIRDWDVGGTYTDTEICPACHGARLRPQYLAVTLDGHNIHQLSEMPLWALQDCLLRFSPGSDHSISEVNLDTARRRLNFLNQVGLSYLHLNRLTSSLSAGEAQRIKLAGLLGSGLTSLTVLLDEPTRGLHPAEVGALISTLHSLRDEGNTVVVVEHDLALIRAADHVIDMGPGPGTAGGAIIAQGKPELIAEQDTPTGRWLLDDRVPLAAAKRRQPSGWLTVREPVANNLKGQDVSLPLGGLVGVCGISGSGKSSLIIDTLGRALAPTRHTTSVASEPVDPGPHRAIEGAPRRTLLVDQTRAGVTSPAAYLDLSTPLRRLFAESDEARALGIGVDDLSLRCSDCNGRGYTKLDLGFLPSVRTPCETCRGTGYLAEAWDVRLRGLSLPELSTLTIDQVHELFGDEAGLARALTAARDVGLGYLVLQQPGYALSGGEAQRLKIARELSRKTTPATLYLLDEPTVGQHLADVIRLVKVLRRLVDAGHSVIIVEHHPHLLAACDWLVELGPGGGPDGGWLIAQGTPETVAAGETPTAGYLRPILEITR